MSEATPGSNADTTSTLPAGPVTGAERFVSIDILRGVAILGILVMNIYAFAMPMQAYSNPLLMGGTEPHNLGTWFFTHFFFDLKFLSIFAMLFGAGLVLMTGRAEQRGAKPARIYYRRQFWLLVIGAMHGYLLWWGDILFAYAAIGMLAYLFRNRSPKTLIAVAFLLLPVALVFNFGNAIFMQSAESQIERVLELQAAGEPISAEEQNLLDQWQTMTVFMTPSPEAVQKDIDTHLGTYSELLKHRVPFVAMLQVFSLLFWSLWRILALMLIGMALMKLAVLTGERSAGFYRKLMLTGYALGLPLTVYSGIDLHAQEFDPIYALRWGGWPNYFGSLLVALGHIGMVMLIVKTGYLRRLMQRFAAVGRMALTNYLMHSVILTTVFYGYGLGLYGQIPRFAQMGFVVAVVGLQLILSPWWLARYRFGPVEWLWRSITYWKLQPMRQG